MLKPIQLLTLATCLAVIPNALLFAEEEGQEGADPAATAETENGVDPSPLREEKPAGFPTNIVFLGTKPRTSFIVEDGGGLSVAPAEPGTAPPQPMRYESKGRTRRATVSGPVVAVMNVPGTRVLVPESAEALDLEAANGTNDDGEIIWEAYASVRLPGGPATVIITPRSGGDWSGNPRVVALPDDSATFPVGSVRVCNFSQSPIAGRIGDQTAQVAPLGQTIMKAGPGVHEFLFAVATADGRQIPVVNTSRLIRDDDRVVIAIWDSPGEDADRPVESTLFQIPP